VRDTSAPRAQTTSYFLCFGLVGILSATLGPSLASFATATHSPLTALSILFTVDAFGSVCGSLLAGQLLNRFPPHLQAIAGLTGITAITVLMPFISDRMLLIPAWWFLGMSKTFLIVTVNTLLVWVRRGTVGPYMNAADFCLGLGSLLMPIVIAQSINWTGDVRWAYWVAAAVAVTLIVRLGTLASPSLTAEPDEPPAARVNYRFVLSVALLLFFYVGAEVSFAGWIPSYSLTRGIAGSAADAAYFTSLFWVAVTVGRLLWLPFTRRMSAGRMIMVSVLACVLTLAAIALSPAAPVFLGVGTVVFGLSMSSIFPSAFTLLARRGQVTGRVSALCLCAASIGAMLFPLLIGQFLISHG
jgi:FHS family Na+ dependent glucose MFS transporter 1